MIAVTAAALCAAAWAAPGAARAQEGPTLRLAEMTFVASRDAVNELVVQAENMVVPPPGDVANLETVRMVMRNPGGRSSFEMTCRSSDLELESADFVARGDVQGRTADGRRFFTEWLHYHNGSGVVSSDAPVRIVDGGHVISGRGFVYHVADGRFVLKGGAHIVQE